MNRKILAVIICACVLLAVIGCKPTTTEPSPEPEDGNVAEPEVQDTDISGIDSLDTTELDSEVDSLADDLEDW